MTAERVIPSVELYTDKLRYQGVIEDTASYLDFFEAPDLYDVDSARYFFKTQTLPFIDEVTQGFHLTSEELRSSTSEEYQKVLSRQKALPIHPEGTTGEAFSHALIIFAFMPDLVRHDLREQLAPPNSPSALLERLIEMNRQTWAIANGLVNPSEIEDFSTLRTVAFFKVGRRLPLKRF